MRFFMIELLKLLDSACQSTMLKKKKTYENNFEMSLACYRGDKKRGMKGQPLSE